MITLISILSNWLFFSKSGNDFKIEDHSFSLSEEDVDYAYHNPWLSIKKYSND